MSALARIWNPTFLTEPKIDGCAIRNWNTSPRRRLGAMERFGPEVVLQIITAIAVIVLLLYLMFGPSF